MSDLGRAITRLYRARARVYALLTAADLAVLVGITPLADDNDLVVIYRDLSTAIDELERNCSWTT